MKTKHHPRQGACIPARDLEDLMPDQQHIAAALYCITRAAAGMHVIPDAEMHGLLRDAEMHCEAARLRWTRKEREKIAAVGRKIFGEKS